MPLVLVLAELNELYLLLVGLIFNVLSTIVLNLKTVPPINDVVQLRELRVLFNITFRGH